MPNKKTVKGSRKVSKKSSKKNNSKKVSKKISNNSSDELRDIIDMSDENVMPNNDLNNFNGMMPNMQNNMMQQNMMQPNMMQPNMMPQNMMQQNIPNAISPSQVDPMMIQQYVPYQQNHNLGGMNANLMSPTQMVQGLNNFSSNIPDLTNNPMNLNSALTPSFNGLNQVTQPMMNTPQIQQPVEQQVFSPQASIANNMQTTAQPNIQGLLNFARM